MTPEQFKTLSAFEQHKVRAATRAGRSNLQCLHDIFGAGVVPTIATDFHTEDGKAVFLDARKHDWQEPVAEVDLTPELSHKLGLVGMRGTLGWSLRAGGGLLAIGEKL